MTIAFIKGWLSRRWVRAGLGSTVVLAVAGVIVAAALTTTDGSAHAVAAGADTITLACLQRTDPASGSTTAAVDCRTVIAWHSEANGAQQLVADLGEPLAASQVTLVWGTGYASSFEIRTSPDDISWHVAARANGGSAQTQAFTLPSSTMTQWIQLDLYGHTGTSGFTIAELSVSGARAITPVPTSPPPTPTSAPSPTVKPDPSPSPSPGRTVKPTSTTPPPAGPVVHVSSSAQLIAALAAVTPGDTVQLAPGSYDGAFFATGSGTANAPITLTGPRTAVLSNRDGCDPYTAGALPGVSYCGYGLHLNHVAYWRLTGFSVTDSAKGIVLDGSSHNRLQGIEVSDIGDEGIHLRAASSDNTVIDCVIHDTGRDEPGFGEGLYFGSAQSNWSKYGSDGGSGPDLSNNNQAIDNTFGPNIAAEHIDIKEGTTGGVVRGNTFDARGISGENFADSWIDLKGSGYTLTGNTGTYSGGRTLADGFQVHRIVPGSGCGNVFRANASNLGGVGAYAIDVTDQSSCGSDPNVVYSSNTVTDATKGLTNIAVTQGQ